MLIPLMVITGTTLAITIFGKWISSMIFMSINRNLHAAAIRGVVHTHMEFFDTNTSGRIINRLSKDIAVLDRFVFEFLEMIDYITKCLFSLALIVISSKFTLILVII